MIVQGGGPTAVFNTTLAEIVAEAQRQQSIGSIYGARYGVEGLVRRDFVELTNLTAEALHLLRRTPGAALGSSRHGLSDEELERTVETLRPLHIDQMPLRLAGA
jgi:6-phosphofructokinase 1